MDRRGSFQVDGGGLEMGGNDLYVDCARRDGEAAVRAAGRQQLPRGVEQLRIGYGEIVRIDNGPG